MVTRWLVTIYVENDKGEVEQYVVEEDDFLSATRWLYRYEAPRNWSVFKFDIERVYGLV